MTPTHPTLPPGAAAHAHERARLADLRRSIRARLAADLVLLDRLDGTAAVQPASPTRSTGGAA